jgi:iron complex transport system substrate-binding protein
LGLGALNLVLLTGCGDAPSQPTTTPSARIKVASLVPAATDVILNMGAGDHLVAVSNWDPKLPELAGLPRVGDYRTVDWEKIAETRPGVMIVQFAPGKMPPGLEDKARSMNIRLVNIRIYRLDDIFTTIDQLGDAIGEPAKAAAAHQKLRAELDGVRAHVAGKPPVRTLLIRSETSLASVGGGNFMDDLLTIAGGKNVLQGGDNSYPTIDREQLLGCNPDAVILLMPGESPQVIEKAQEYWRSETSVSAVQHHRVYVLTDSYLLLPGMSAGKIAMKIADLLHPDSTTEPAKVPAEASAKVPGKVPGKVPAKAPAKVSS